MSTFGGMGGQKRTRPRNPDDLFESAVARALDLSDDSIAREVWSALANVDWRHENGDEAGYSFRAAGDLIASIRGHGTYLDWYCCGPYAWVSDRVSEAMAKEGWSWEALEMLP
jgi:hypothetical protein